MMPTRLILKKHAPNLKTTTHRNPAIQMDPPAPAASAGGAAPSPWSAHTPPNTPPRQPKSPPRRGGLVLSLEEVLKRGEGALPPVGREEAERARGVRVEVTSPRALEACRRLGINPSKDLVLLPLSVCPVIPAASASPSRPTKAAAVAGPALPPEAEAKVFEHRRQRLLERCKMIRRERQALLRREQEAQQQLEWATDAPAAGGTAGWAPWSSDPSWRGHRASPGPGPASPVPAALRAPPSSPALGSPARVDGVTDCVPVSVCVVGELLMEIDA